MVSCGRVDGIRGPVRLGFRLPDGIHAARRRVEDVLAVLSGILDDAGHGLADRLDLRRHLVDLAGSPLDECRGRADPMHRPVEGIERLAQIAERRADLVGPGAHLDTGGQVAGLERTDCGTQGEHAVHVSTRKQVGDRTREEKRGARNDRHDEDHARRRGAGVIRELLEDRKLRREDAAGEFVHLFEGIVDHLRLGHRVGIEVVLGGPDDLHPDALEAIVQLEQLLRPLVLRQRLGEGLQAFLQG